MARILRLPRKKQESRHQNQARNPPIPSSNTGPPIRPKEVSGGFFHEFESGLFQEVINSMIAYMGKSSFSLASTVQENSLPWSYDK
jgi:hypothetical protein